MLKPTDRAWVEIDLTAVAHNVKECLKLLAPHTALMAIVKADAYGHGAVGVSQTALAAGATWLGVATIPEGIQLRSAGITAPILILGATNSAAEVRAIAENYLQPTLCNIQQAITFHEVAAQTGVVLLVHLKIDTGMTRLGMNWQEVVEFGQLVQSLPYLEMRSLYSHLATADELESNFLKVQHQRFEQAIAQLKELGIQPPCLHLCNTAGMLSSPSLHYDMVRVGLGLHGFCPAPHLQSQVNLRPAMQVQARITQIKEITSGTGISYGHSYVADRPMKIGTVAIGYADGVPRGLSNQIQVLVGDRLVNQVGTITMDQCLIDLSDCPEVSVGDAVTFLGILPGTTAADWAERLGTIPWEILCGFKHRLPRVVSNVSS